MIKLENSLCSPFPRGPSTCLAHEQPQSARTVHHHPQHYQVTVQNYTIIPDPKPRPMPPPATIIKSEPVWNEDHCPNVEIRNGVLCAVEREARDIAGIRAAGYSGRDLRTTQTTFERRYGTTTSSADNSFQKFSSPSLDYQTTQVSRLQQKKQLFLTQKLLELRKKNFHRMSVNLDTLLPQEDSASSMFDPATSGMLLFPDLSDQKAAFASSMGLGFDMSLQELMNCDDPSMVQSFYPEGDLDKTVFERHDFTPVTPASEFSQDAWVTTPISLPPTPEGTSPNSPTTDMYSTQSTSTPVMLPHPQIHTSPVMSAVTPLTPDSLPGGEKDEDQQVKEILLFLKESEVLPLAETSSDQFDAFQLPLDATYNQHSALSSPSTCSSTYSSYQSTPQSPLSPTTQPSPDETAFPSFIPQPDTLQTLLTTGPPPLTSTSSTSDFPLSHCPDAPQSGPVVDATNLGKNHSRKRARSSSRPQPAQRKRRVSTTSRKERKKEQNKTAALRYRQKKREEKFNIEDQQNLLEEENRLLKSTVSSLESEINYLKKLWDEVVKARMEHMASTCD